MTTLHLAFTASQRGITKAQTRRLWEELNLVARQGRRLICHLGDCIGGDAQIYYLCKALQLYLIGHPGNLQEKRSFLVYDELRSVTDNITRNHDMVDESSVLFACPREPTEIIRSGTWATWRYAKAQHKQVYRIGPAGDLHQP